MGIQTKTKRRTQGSTLRSGLRADTWRRLRANFLRHDARNFAAHTRVPRSTAELIDAPMGL
eukprot:4331243-Pleurochrysis_carterae.AAC.1